MSVASLTHSFTKRADLTRSTAANESFGEPWDIHPDPADPLERDDQGKTEYGVFGPMPSNPLKRARYMLLANYLELVGSGSTMGGASEREKREEQAHFERSVFSHTLQQVDEQLVHARAELGRVDARMVDVMRELRERRAAITEAQGQQTAAATEIKRLNEAVVSDTAAVKVELEKAATDETKATVEKDVAVDAVKAAQDVVEKERADVLKKFGLEYDPETKKYFEIREDGSRRQKVLTADMQIASSSEFLQLENAQFKLHGAERVAGVAITKQRETQDASRDRLQELKDRIAFNEKALAEQQAKYDAATKIIEEQKAALQKLETEKTELTKEREELAKKITTLEDTKAQMQTQLDELQTNKETLKESLVSYNQYRSDRHAERLAKYGNDPVKLAAENARYEKYQTAYNDVCTMQGTQPTQVADLTGKFNLLQQLEKPLPGAVVTTGPTTVVAAADPALPKVEEVDPINGDTSANAGSVADPKPAEQTVADADADADPNQNVAPKDGTAQPNTALPKKPLSGMNSTG